MIHASVTFERVVCGVDLSEQSLEAVRQAARLVEPDGALTLVAVAELEVAVQAGWAATTVAEELRDEAEKALERARAEIAAHALMVDAKDETAAAFYRHHGFIALPDLPCTLFLPLAGVPAKR